MARMRSAGGPNVIEQPLNGLHESAAYSDQPNGTTADAQNVRRWDAISGRTQISRRPGLTKYCSEAIATGQSIQDINAVAVTRDQTVPAGKLLSVAGSSGIDEPRIYSGSAGATLFTGSTLQGSQTLGCIDDDGEFYVASINAGSTTVGLVKISPTGLTTTWSVTMSITGTGTGGKIWGLGAVDGVVYLWLIDIDGPGLYRFDTEDGARLDPAAWKDTNAGMVSATATAVRAYQNLAIGANVVAVVGGLNSNLVLQQINTGTGAITFSTTLQAFDVYETRIVADQGGNFYILTNASGAGATNNYLMKVNTLGSKVSAFGTSGEVASTTKGARDIAYEPTTYSICIVGTAIFPNITGAGADDSYQRLGAVDGVLVHQAKPGTFTTWNAICADGAGYMRVRRSVAAANDDLARITMPGVVDWAIQTSLGTTSEMLWLQCSGYNLASVGSEMDPRRLSRLVAVAGGALYRFNQTEVTTIDSAFVSSGAPVVWSSLHQLKLYYADGINYRYYDAQTDATGTLTATAGSLPASADGSKPTLLMSWRERLVWAGVKGDMQNYFASAMGNAADYDYSPADPTATQAFAGNLANAGKCPDKITALIPYTDDMAIFGCDHSIWRMTGDPADGGRFDQISDVTGIAWGRAFCTDPQGNLYFIGTRGGFWKLAPNGKPEELSQGVAERFLDINTVTNIIRLAWVDDWGGVMVYITPKDSTEETEHYFWDRGSGAFSCWPDVFANLAHNPLAIYTFDGDEPDDRVLLIGTRDGFVLQYDDSAEDDDGSAIVSRVQLTPIRDKNGLLLRLNDLQAEMGQNSSDVTWGVLAGESVAAAVNATASITGTFIDGRNYSKAVRKRGHCLIVELSSSLVDLPWTLVVLRGEIERMPAGVAQRSFIRSEAPDMPVDVPTPDPEPDPGTPWTPDLLSSLRLWTYGGDSSLSSLADGDPVNSWTNRGSAGGTVDYGGVAGTRPIIKLAANGLNNLPIVRFDGSNDFLGTSLASGQYISAAAHSMFVVAKGNSASAGVAVGFISDAAAFWDIYQKSSGAVGLQNWDGTYDTAEVSGTLNAWSILTAWHGSGTIGMRMNGDDSTDTTATSGNTTNTAGFIYYGRRNGAGYLACDIAEVIITNVEITDAQKQLVEGYLAHKYALTSLLPTGHPYKTTAPTV